MTDLPILKMFADDELTPARSDEAPARGDRVEFWLANGSAGAIGRVSAIAEGGGIKVRIHGVGSFLVPPGYATVIERAH